MDRIEKLRNALKETKNNSSEIIDRIVSREKNPAIAYNSTWDLES